MAEAFTCSGIAVVARPDRFGDVCRALEGLSGVQVHVQDPPSGRIVVTQVTPTTADQAEGLRRIQQLPGVLAADLVYHVCDTSAGPAGE